LLESVARDRHHRSKVARSPSPEGSRLCWRNVARSNTEASVGAVSGWRGHLPRGLDHDRLVHCRM
jgi:hypothetical protein